MSEVAEKSSKNLAEAATNAIPSGYKQTDVGVIPDHWGVSRLRDLLKEPPKYGINAPAVPLEGTLPVYIRITDISEDGYFKPSEKVGVRSSFSGLYQLADGDVVLARTGASVGKSYLYKEDDGVLVYAGFLIKVSPDKKKLEPRFLSQYLKTQRYWSWVTVNSMRSGQPGINGNEYGDLLIPLPKIQEQTAIANALSDVDALVSELEELIAKKQAIKTATMQQLLTGRTRLPQFALREDGKPKGTKPSELGEIPEDWERISIGRDTVLKARIGWQALTTKEYQTTGDIYLVTGTDFDSGAVKWERCFYVSEWRYKQDQNIQLRNDDVLITKDGTIGKVGYVTALSRPATLNSGVFVVRPKNNNLMQRFLFYVLTSRVFDDFINRITAGSTITHLYQKDFVNFEFSAPCIEEQTAIATILSDMDEEIQALEQRLGKTRQIKQGMMQELLTGKTRLLQPLNKESQHG
ncbi:restriction endonuclease subunit S [Pseudidiomarina aquimaris]|uniref:Restriction endonuclease subunit S n=1 Tax=Pseudidiomarina aquimaris TaxID=641841 RepID=A0A432XNG1_9GAMM|nr:restriction endonuclease subunit S [Pseudidiomarina aquimaris]RUO50258.1 restriction endonuclease subunit S [Pseudidiomarina aquimaris]|tara:strand:+ start:5218 stop:6612 length:1395 start_codon:yes stop_codon:yes gene_type:complete